MQGITPGRVQDPRHAARVSAGARLAEPVDALLVRRPVGAGPAPGSPPSCARPSDGRLLEAVAGAEVARRGGRPVPRPRPGSAASPSTPRPASIGWWEGFPPAGPSCRELLLGHRRTDRGSSSPSPSWERTDSPRRARGPGPLAAGEGREVAGTVRPPPDQRRHGPPPSPGPGRLGPRWSPRRWPPSPAGSCGRWCSPAPSTSRPSDPSTVEAVMERVPAPSPARRWSTAAGPATAPSLLGASPERLFSPREAGRLETQALASTAAPGELERLTGGRKEAREHAAVVESIRARAGSRSRRGSRSAPPPSRSPSATSRTSARRCRARLRPGVTPADVVRALHPTAAVGGTPRAQALGLPPEPRAPRPGLVRRGHRLDGRRPAPTSGSRSAAPSSAAPPPGSSPAPAAVTGSTAEGEWTRDGGEGALHAPRASGRRADRDGLAQHPLGRGPSSRSCSGAGCATSSSPPGSRRAPLALAVAEAAPDAPELGGARRAGGRLLRPRPRARVGPPVAVVVTSGTRGRPPPPGAWSRPGPPASRWWRSPPTAPGSCTGSVPPRRCPRAGSSAASSVSRRTTARPRGRARAAFRHLRAVVSRALAAAVGRPSAARCTSTSPSASRSLRCPTPSPPPASTPRRWRAGEGLRSSAPWPARLPSSRGRAGGGAPPAGRSGARRGGGRAARPARTARHRGAYPRRVARLPGAGRGGEQRPLGSWTARGHSPRAAAP